MPTLLEPITDLIWVNSLVRLVEDNGSDQLSAIC